MDKDEQLAFMAGVTATMKSRGMTQKQLADSADTTAVTISRYKNGLGMPSEDWITKICKALGKTERELIKTGSPAVAPPVTPTNYVDPDSIVPFAQTLAVQMAKTRDRMHFWKEVYEVLPAATLIIKDGVVVYQNSASRSLGLTVGTDLCDTCISVGTDHCSGYGCPIKKAAVTGQTEKQFKAVGGVEFCLIAAPMRYAGCEYFIALAVDITKPKPDEVNP